MGACDHFLAVDWTGWILDNGDSALQGHATITRMLEELKSLLLFISDFVLGYPTLYRGCRVPRQTCSGMQGVLYTFAVHAVWSSLCGRDCGPCPF